LVKLMTGNT